MRNASCVEGVEALTEDENEDEDEDGEAPEDAGSEDSDDAAGAGRDFAPAATAGGESERGGMRDPAWECCDDADIEETSVRNCRHSRQRHRTEVPHGHLCKARQSFREPATLHPFPIAPGISGVGETARIAPRRDRVHWFSLETGKRV